MIRKFEFEDADELWLLYFNTIRNVNIRDYTVQQVEAWARDDILPEVWLNTMNAISPFICIRGGVIVGYSNLQADGLIDHFFCHHNYQNQGVGREMMMEIHRLAKMLGISLLYSHVSITAKPFFEHFGFAVIKEQHNNRGDTVLINYLMEKQI